MTVNKQGKHRKFRGHRTYHGAHRNWRGGGNRGGRGMAGMHKHKWSTTVKYDKDRFGVHNKMRPTNSHGVSSINVGMLNNMMDSFVRDGFAVKEGSSFKVDLEKAGYQKVLGGGRLTKPLIVQAGSFSKRAEEKIQEAGGQAVKI